MTHIIRKSAQNLARALSKGDVTASALASESIGKLMMALSEGEAEAICTFAEIAPPETYQAVTELSFWDFDEFSVDSFFYWLAVIDLTDSLSPFAKFLKNLDFQYLEMVIRQKLLIHAPEEPEDQPPGDGFYSPDNGQIWIKFVNVDEDEKRLLGKLLALLFQSETRLFYQLVTSGTAASKAELEENCYQTHIKRAAKLGFPEPELAWSTHSIITVKEALANARQGEQKQQVVNNKGTLPELHSTDLLTTYLSSITDCDTASTLAFLSNSAAVVHKIRMLRPGELTTLTEQVYATTNLGLEVLCHSGLSLSDETLDPNFVLTSAYRMGHSKLQELRKQASKLSGKISGEFGERLLKALTRGLPLNLVSAESDSEQVTFIVKPFKSIKELEATSQLVIKLNEGQTTKQ